MRNEWNIMRLAEATEKFEDGDWIESKDQSPNGIRLIQTGNVGSGSFKDRSEKARYVSSDTFKKLRCTEIYTGDCLISRLPDPVGRACVLPEVRERMITVVDCTIIRFKKSLILPKWFVYYTLSKEYSTQISKHVTGATRQRISRKNLGLIEIPVPSIFDQKWIVSILDEMFASIAQAKANSEKNLRNARDLFGSYFQNVFANLGKDWKKKKLSEIALTFGRGKSKHRPRNDKKLYGGQYPFIQTGDVRNSNKYITSFTQTYNEVGLAQSKLWPKGTICITIAANIAETGILDFDSCFPDSMIGLVVDSTKADSDYTYYVLQFLKAELQLQGKGSAQANINVGTFENQLFPFPPLIKQKEIVAILDALLMETQKLETIYQHKLNTYEELKSSILQKAFNGELIYRKDKTFT